MKIGINVAPWVAAIMVLSLSDDAAAAQGAVDPVELVKKTTGKDADDLSSFLTDRGVASVAAASMAGVGASSMTVVEDTKDFAVLLSPFSKDGKGGGFAIAPARIRNPLPRIDLMTEYVASPWWRAVAALNVSGAQGATEIGASEFRRRAFAISTSGYFKKLDDPIVFRALQTRTSPEGKDKTCLDEYFGALGDLTGPETEPEGQKVVVAAQEALKTCVNKVEADAKRKWYLPRWSVALGTGDAKSANGGRSVHTGSVFAIGVTYGAGWGASKSSAKTGAQTASASTAGAEPYGWAISLLGRYAHKEVVLASLEAGGDVVRQNSSLVVGRAVAGTESWRLLAEASNNRSKQQAAGELTMRRALGLDYRVAKDSWLNVRYGKRKHTSGAGEENAALLSVTLGGELLKF